MIDLHNYWWQGTAYETRMPARGLLILIILIWDWWVAGWGRAISDWWMVRQFRKDLGGR